MDCKKNLRLLNAFSFLKNLQFFGALAVPFFLHRAKLDYKGMFLLEAVFSFFLLVFEIPTGVVADRFGRKISLFAGSLFFGAGFLLMGIITAFPLLLAGEIICAFGFSMISGADRALLYEVLKDGGREAEAQTALSRYEAWGTAGMLLAFPAGTLFASSGIVPYTAALGLVLAATGVAIILAGLLVMSVRETTRLPPDGSAIRAGIEGFRFIFRKPALTRFSLNYAIISSLTFFMYWFYQSLLMKNAFPLSLQGFVAAGFNAGAMILLLCTPIIRRRLSTAAILFWSSLIPGVLYVSVAVIPGLPMAFIAIFGVTMLKAFRAPMLGALMNTEIDSSNRATVLSGVSMIERVLSTALYPVAGFLTDLSLNWTFLAMGSITIAFSLFLRVEKDLAG